MTPPDINAKAFHEFELDGWQHASDGYHRYLGSLTSQTIVPLLDSVAAARGSSLLDIATVPDTWPRKRNSADGRPWELIFPKRWC